MTVIEQIRDNSITKLHLTGADDDAIDNAKELVDALEKNSSLVVIELCDDFMGCLRNDARRDVLHALRNISSLQELRLEDGLIQIGDIAEAIAEVKGLQKLTLKGITFQGVEEDFHACEAALNQHGSLKNFAMDDCSPALGDISMEVLNDVAGTKNENVSIMA
eukprot:CAMPEP_0176020916 /NCGR_PEP_ID=MMETSP0120_2-20121206/10146_1 /TAXON_ID=160619 /ORGANISM="Kryptoperidinium foliaceum, Strain CCMP 1326" /LENGTH=162 /DNA_ID=CAMNT_0017354025 /DNA_START=618 /DNA_END=1106 /DNA_ORIENTATION=-